MLTYVASPPLLSVLRRVTSSSSPSRAAPPLPRVPRVPRKPLFGRALLAAAALFVAPLAAATAAAADDGAACAASPAMTLAELPQMRDIDGNVVSPTRFAGKVVFVMNVASACGYTSAGYSLFKKLTDKYSPDSFVAVAIPCNSFGWQESGSPDQIKQFALQRADKLLIMERSDVNGANQHPIVQLAKSKFPARIGWNFDGRYVFDRSGVPVARFGNSATDEQVEAAIDSAL